MMPAYPCRLYPTHAFYNGIRDALREVQFNLQAPEALIGGSFLTAMSIACQGDVNVELPTGQIRRFRSMSPRLPIPVSARRRPTVW